jgi:hypothetical protein
MKDSINEHEQSGLEIEWRLSVGKGATVQEFMAIVRADKLAIDVAPWGEGRLRVNGRPIAH